MVTYGCTDLSCGCWGGGGGFGVKIMSVHLKSGSFTDNTHVVFFFYRMMKERYFKLLFIYVSSLHHVYSGGTPPMKKGKF